MVILIMGINSVKVKAFSAQKAQHAERTTALGESPSETERNMKNQAVYIEVQYAVNTNRATQNAQHRERTTARDERPSETERNMTKQTVYIGENSNGRTAVIFLNGPV